MVRSAPAGALPRVLHELARPLPRLPLALALTGMVRGLARRRPELFERLESGPGLTVLLEPSDLPLRFLLLLAGSRSRVEVLAQASRAQAAARVRAPLLLLLGILEGKYDADALFFSRDLTIEGSTEVVMLLRNAIEEAELGPSDFLGLAGPLARLFDRVVLDLLGLSRRLLAAPGDVRPQAELSR